VRKDDKSRRSTEVRGLTMRGLSRGDWLVLALFAFVTIGTAVVILNWLVG